MSRPLAQNSPDTPEIPPVPASRSFSPTPLRTARAASRTFCPACLLAVESPAIPSTPTKSPPLPAASVFSVAGKEIRAARLAHPATHRTAAPTVAPAKRPRASSRAFLPRALPAEPDPPPPDATPAPTTPGRTRCRRVALQSSANTPAHPAPADVPGSKASQSRTESSFATTLRPNGSGAHAACTALQNRATDAPFRVIARAHLPTSV